MKFLEFIIFIIIASISIKFIIWFSKRTELLLRIYSLKNECDAKITLLSFPYRPMWLAPKGADIRVEILDTVYFIRIYSGGGAAASVHFANEEYSAVFTRLSGAKKSPKGTGSSSLAMSLGINLSARVIHLAPMQIPKNDATLQGKKTVRVLILNPAPGILSYVTKEKTSIKIAFTGDEMHGMLVFTSSTFTTYADRMKREEERQRAEGESMGYADFSYYNE